MDTLAPELLMLVFSLVRPGDLPAVAAVCRHWAEVLLGNSPRTLDLSEGGRTFEVDDRYVHFVARKLDVTWLKLGDCAALSEASVGALLQHARSLRHLELSHATINSLMARQLRTRLDGTRALDTLVIPHCLLWTSMQGWPQAERLRHLDIQRCAFGAPLEDMWDWPSFTALESLAASALTPRVLSHLACLRRLRKLSLVHCDIRVNDETLETFRRIETLELDGCSIYSNFPVRPIWAALADVLRVAQNLQTLKLHSIGPAVISDEYLAKWVEQCPHLESLEVVCSEMGRASNVGPKTFRALADTCGPVLRRLSLFQCDASDDSVAFLLQRAPALEAFELPYALKLTDESVNLLALVCPNLASVDISGCVNVSIQALEFLRAHCRQLKTIKCFGLHEALSATPRQEPSLSSHQQQIVIDYPVGDTHSLFVQHQVASLPVVRTNNLSFYQLKPAAQKLVLSGLQLVYAPRTSTSILPAHVWPRGQSPSNERPMEPMHEGHCDRCPPTQCGFVGCAVVIPACHLEGHYDVCVRSLKPCLYRQMGCPAVVPRASFAKHLHNCSFRTVLCRLCMSFIKHCHFTEHVDRHYADLSLSVQPMCPLRNEGCLHSSHDINRHLNVECRYYMIHCQCCDAEVPRHQYDQHPCVVVLLALQIRTER